MKTKPTSKAPFVRAVGREQRIDDPKAKGTIKLEFLGATGVTGHISVAAELMDYPKKVRAELRNSHAVLPNNEQETLDMVSDALSDINAIPLDMVTGKSGWYGGAFVLPGRTIGKVTAKPRLSPPNDGFNGRDEESGTAEDWKTGLVRCCKNSRILTFAVAAAFAAPLLSQSKVSEGAVFLFTGTSGTGKTTALRAAMSVYGAAAIEFIPTFDATGRALEELCAAYNDTLIALDEVNRAGTTPADREKKLSEIAYMIPSGTGRKRSGSVDSKGLGNLTWRVIVLGSTEGSFYAGQGAARRQTGEKVRLVEIPVPEPKLGGIFNAPRLELAERSKLGRELSQQVDEVIRANYGVAIRPYIHYLLERGTDLEVEVKDLMDEFMDRIGGSSTPFALRLAAKFALVCAGGRIAVRAGVAPFSERRCIRACETLYHQSLEAMDGRPEMTAADFLDALLAATKEPGRLPWVERGQHFSGDDQQALGVVRTLDGHETALIGNNRLKQITGDDVPADVLEMLQKRNVLVPGKDGNMTRQVVVKGWQGGDRPRFYCFDLEAARMLRKVLT